MTYIVNPIWFYLMELSEGVKCFGLIIGIVIAISGIIGFGVTLFEQNFWYGYGYKNEDDKKGEVKVKKFFAGLIVVGSILTFIGIITPSQPTVEKMMIASFVTEENVEKAKGEAKELVDYITEKIIEVKQEENK